MKDLHVVILVKRVSSSKCELALGGSENLLQARMRVRLLSKQ